ncbi:MAG: glycosyltransferase family 2 protein [Patescibacteria group bacterium]|nr:glycosyltransferase family 2 protein [Patescibacteria group bacterium]MCL5432421.1 glycosyltransferase family 2 protein [Patescibacteria group bacterium]
MNDRIVDYIHYHPVRTQRGLEILTGLVPWLIIASVIVGSFFIPDVIAYFIIAFNIYWLYRCVQLAFYATLGYLNIRATKKINWQEKLKPNSVWNIIIIPMVKEPLELAQRNLDSLLAQSFPTKKIMVVIAMEERAGKEFNRKRAELLLQKYQHKFGHFLVTSHPLAPGETIGKHSNEAYAARQAKKTLVEKLKVPIEDILITTSDIDCVFPEQYFSLLTYKFLTSPHPFNNFFQAPIFMHNNIQRVPVYIRLPSIIGGIYFLSVLQKYSQRFLNYSTYSLSLRLLDQVGYWDVDVIPEDAHLYYKCYFFLKGKTYVTPVYLPVSIDAAEAGTHWETFKNGYQQHKRWAWGAVDIPYVVKNFFLHPEIPFWDKLVKLSLALETHFAWSTSWFLITLGATIPTLLNPAFARTTLGFNLSRTSSLILTICMIGAVAITVYDLLLRNKLRHMLLPVTYLQWLLLPITGLVLGSMPGLESQTRLMLGKYLGYHVTEKKA